MTTRTKISPELAFVTEYMDFSKMTGVAGSTLERHQIDFMNITSDFTADVKSRQIGWSWGAALWAVARAVLKSGHGVFFISMSQDEANNKIAMARKFINCFDVGSIPKLIKENTEEVLFSNNSFIRSEPSIAPRGASQADIILDEYAFVKQDVPIYQALLPIISRGGKIRMGSTPYGMRGRFHDIFVNSAEYPDYVRRSIPWWSSEGLCTNIKFAPTVHDMGTRVQLFGTQRLRNIYNNSRIEEFMQEYCCSWAAGDYQWINETELALAMQWYTLNTNCNDVVLVDTSFSEDAYNDIIVGLEKLREFILSGRVSPQLYVGYDVGRRRDTSDLCIISAEPDGTYPVRLTAHLNKADYDTQFALLQQVDTILNPAAIHIDATGIGHALAERAENMMSSATGVWFSTEKKVDMAFLLKQRFEACLSPVPDDERLLIHIRSIHKEVTVSGRIVFDTSSHTSHHADAFWALALAHYGTVSGFIEVEDVAVRR